MSKSLQPHGLWTAACQASPSFTNSWGLLKLMSIESMMLSNYLILCHPLLLLLSIFPSIRVFPNELALCIRWPKYWSFSFSISSSNAYSGLICLRVDPFDLPAVQGTLKVVSSTTDRKLILWHSAFFMVQLSIPYITTENIAFTKRTFVGQVMCLLFNTLSKFNTLCLKSKCLLISCL